MLWRNLQKIVLARDFFCPYSFDNSTKNQNQRNGGSSCPKTVLISLKILLDCRSNTIEKQIVINLRSRSSKCYKIITVIVNCIRYSYHLV